MTEEKHRSCQNISGSWLRSHVTDGRWLEGGLLSHWANSTSEPFICLCGRQDCDVLPELFLALLSHILQICKVTQTHTNTPVSGHFLSCLHELGTLTMSGSCCSMHQLSQGDGFRAIKDKIRFLTDVTPELHQEDFNEGICSSTDQIRMKHSELVHHLFYRHIF